jgi:hypothetical protein
MMIFREPDRTRADPWCGISNAAVEADPWKGLVVPGIERFR